MKILVIIEACLAGVGRHVIDLCRGLVKQGHDVHLLYSSSRIDALFQRGLAELQNLNVHLAPLPMKRNPHPSDIVSALKIRRYLRANGPFDVVHGHSSKGGALARLAGVGMPGIRIYTPHALFTMNPELKAMPRWIYGAIERFLDRLSDGIILVSDDEYRHAVEVGLSKEKLFVIPNGIDLSIERESRPPKRAFNLSQSDLCIGCVARFGPQKALEHLLEAFALLAPKFATARLVMVGDGPLEADLHARAQRLGIHERVIWPGPVDGPQAMQAFDIFALPSRYESFPYVLLEAMAAGLPVVMTQVGGAGTLILDEVNGRVVPVGRPDLLATALQALLAESELRHKMGEESLRRVRQFSLEVMLQKTLDIYATLLTRRK